MTDSAPTIEVSAANDLPPHSRITAIEVSGSNFPPGTAVNIRVDGGAKPLRGTAHVRADGDFEWQVIARPQRACNASVTATVHGSDGIRVEASTEVFCQ